MATSFSSVRGISKRSTWNPSEYWGRLIEPAAALLEPERRRRARMLAALLIFLTPLIILEPTMRVLAEPDFNPLRDPKSGTMMATAIVLLVAYALSRTKRYVWGAALTVGVLSLSPFAMLIIRGNYTSSGVINALIWLVLALLLGSLLFSLRGTLILVAVNLGGIFALPILVADVTFSTVIFPLGFLLGTSTLIMVAAAVRHRDLKQIEQQSRELSESEERFRSLFEATVEGIAVHRDGVLLDANYAFASMFGYSLSEVAGIDLSAFLAEESRDEVMKKIRSREATSYEASGRRKDGTTLVVELVSKEHRYRGQPVFVTALRDVTERKRAEEKLRQTATQLERSNAELEQFAYVASHDLQEPLRMISSYVQLLKRRYGGKLDADADQFITYAVEGASRMQTLIHDLLAYSRVGTRGKPFATTDCGVVLTRAMQNLTVAIEESQATVTHDTLPTMMADGTQLVQLFQNLLGNAIKFRGDRPPEIHVGLTREDGSWVFSVKDNGIGLEPAYADRIFLIFQRLHNREQYPGTGIGLAVCKRIIERHGGRIWVESQPGMGATFYFTLPAARG